LLKTCKVKSNLVGWDVMIKKLLVLALWFTSFAVAPPVFAAPNNVVINELQCDGTDWIEIYNPTNLIVNLSGWILTDRNPAVASPSGKHLYVFTSGNVIQPKAHRVIKQGTAGINLKFGIDCTRQETIFLGRGSGALWEEIDSVNPPPFEAGATYGRLTDGSATWGNTVPTEKAANTSMLPKLNGTGIFSCKANKKCSLSLTATRNGTFSLANPKTGVSLASGGALTITARKKQNLTISITMTNSYGSVNKTITVKFA
jgi:hypothetical protein